MARSKRPRSAPRARKAKRRRAPPAPKQEETSTPWPTIEEFLETGGSVSLGAFDYSRRYTAVATDADNMLVALVRRSGETLHALLDRLDAALGPAIEDQVFLDEINSPSSR